MEKVPTIFERDWEGDRSRVLNDPVVEASWVFAGDGIATRKYNGASCMFRNGTLYKRLEQPQDRPTPEGWIPVDHDTVKETLIGWVPTGEGPEDKWFREALANTIAARGPLADGTYELLGPKVQKNEEGLSQHELIAHAQAEELADCPRDFEGLRAFLEEHDIEGIVWHHPDGRMAKIKGRDFGISRVARAAASG